MAGDYGARAATLSATGWPMRVEERCPDDASQDEPGARKRSDALLEGQKRLLEMVALGEPLPRVLDALCRLVERTAEGCHCSVLLLGPGGTAFEPGAAPSLPGEYFQTKRGRPVKCTSGPCGMAASLGTQVIVADIESDTRWDAEGWRRSTLSHGLRSVWSTPIFSRARKPLGTFALYQREPGSPSPLHRDLIEQFTHIASIAIERSLDDAALKRSGEFLAEAQRLSSTGSFSWQVATGEITCSEQFYRIFALDREGPVTVELVRSRVHPEDIAAFDAVLDQARGEGSAFEHEHRLLLPDGSIKHLLMVAYGARDEHHGLEFIGAVQDITQRRVAEAALSRARAELAYVSRLTTLSTLTASIAHEVNQPLSGIITNASTCLRMLAADPPNVAGALETARRTIRDGNRAADVIARLRALFRGKRAVNDLVDLRGVVRDVLTMSLTELQRKRILTCTELPDGPATVRGDRVQLQQVILNLLLNACDAMHDVEDRPRQLLVGVECDAGCDVRVFVTDAGRGFDARDAQRLFDPFYTTKAGGMGIGLSVSRAIIETHGGRIWATPNSGPGATFWFSLPAAPTNGTDVGLTPSTPAAVAAEQGLPGTA